MMRLWTQNNWSRGGIRTTSALALLLALSILSGCRLWPGGQAHLSGTVQGESAAAREAGRIVLIPIRGATVTCAGVSGITGPDGAFQLDVPAASQYRCAVSAPEYTSLTFTLAGATGTTLSASFSAIGSISCAVRGRSAFICPHLLLAPGILSGIVTNPHTDSVASNVKVECWDLNQAVWSGGQPLKGAITTTDQYGRYTLSLPVDPYGCVANDDARLYHAAVAPAAITSADMEICDPRCPAFDYHLGQVMHTYSAYVIFWLPPGSTFEPGGGNARFESLIRRYFTDVGGTPFYAILTQYWDRQGPISGSAALGGTYVDTTPYPHAGTSADPLYDSDIQAAVSRAITANNWTPDLSHEFFVITGYGAEECIAASSASTCTFRGGQNGYCGYHSSTSQPTSTTIYAYIADNAACSTLPSFASHPAPNGDPVADGTLSAISHEQFESITDPVNGGWYDSSPYTGEIGDKCNTDYGAMRSDGGNVTLHGHPYILQGEWSLAASACAFSYAPLPTF